MEKLPEYQPNTKLSRQLGFLIEIDRIKSIVRKSKLIDGTRFENDAEHSWTICIMAMLLKEYSNFDVDLEKVIKMLLLHDVIEVDAGDTFLYAPERGDVHAKELLAAERIFGLLEKEQRDEFLGLWVEFEERETNEARFAAVFDRIEPILQNYVNEGFTWKEHDVSYEMVVAKNRHIKEGSEEIWEFVLFVLNEAVEKGFLKKYDNPASTST